MVEFPSPLEKQPASQPTQALSPVMNELKSRINSTANFKHIYDAYESSTDSGKELLLKLIDKNTTEIEDCVDNPDDMLRLLNNIIQESEATVTKSEATVTKSEATVTKSEATSRNNIANKKSINTEFKKREDDIEKESTEGFLKKANEQLNDTYALFGDES
jgi:hypothetical protein